MSGRIFHLSGLIALLLGAAPAPGQNGPDERTFDYVCAGGLTGDLRDDQYVCRGASITDGVTTMSADSASTKRLDFDRSEWQLSGDVLVAVDSAELHADSAVFVFEADELVSFALSGAPAVVTDFIEESGTPLRGSARDILYAAENSTLKLDGDVRFEVGEDGIDTCGLTYHLEEKSFGTDDCGVRATLRRPEERAEAAAEQPDQR